MIVAALTVLSGMIVGLVLGVLGAGGSILAVPLLLYVVGVTDPHVAIGTSAVAVGLSAAVNLALYARAGYVKWPCAAAFAASGTLGAFIGAAFGKATDGSKLLLAFAAAMIGVGISMLLRKPGSGDPDVFLTPKLAARLMPAGFLAGGASGFFGIGGGFLIVPGLVAAANMTTLHAIGSSLVSVTAFAAATAISYAASGLVDWRVAALFVAGGTVGGILGQGVSKYLAAKKGALSRLFAVFIFITAIYIAIRTLTSM